MNLTPDLRYNEFIPYVPIKKNLKSEKKVFPIASPPSNSIVCPCTEVALEVDSVWGLQILKPNFPVLFT